MATTAKQRASNAARQRAFKTRFADAGFIRVEMWVPAHCIPDLDEQARLLRSNPALIPGPVRDTKSGKLISLRAPRVKLHATVAEGGHARSDR